MKLFELIKKSIVYSFKDTHIIWGSHFDIYTFWLAYIVTSLFMGSCVVSRIEQEGYNLKLHQKAISSALASLVSLFIYCLCFIPLGIIYYWLLKSIGNLIISIYEPAAPISNAIIIVLLIVGLFFIFIFAVIIVISNISICLLLDIYDKYFAEFVNKQCSELIHNHYCKPLCGRIGKYICKLLYRIGYRDNNIVSMYSDKNNNPIQ